MLRGWARRRSAVTLLGCITVVLGTLAASSARAGDWRLTSGLSVEESFSDNANFATGDAERNSEFVTRVSPNISLRGQGGRMSLGLNYTLSQLLHRQDPTKDRNNNDLVATGQMEIWDRVAFIDAQTSIARQVINNEVAFTNSITGENSNRAETRSINITPSFRHHFGNWMETESRTRLSLVSAGSGDLISTRTISNRFRASSGRRFSVFRWSANVRSQKTQSEDDRPAQRSGSLSGNLTYVISPRLSLQANLGAEDIDDSTLGVDPSGLTWSAGFQARPSGKTSFGLTYGLQNATKTIDFNASHRLSERTSISASFNQTLTTTQGQISDALANVIVDPITNEIVDADTNELFDGSSSSLGLQENTFRSERFRLSMNGSRRLTSFNASATWERRKTEATNITELTYGARVGLNRTFNARSSGNVGLNYQFTDFGTADQRTSTQTSLSSGISYRLAGDVSLSFSYNLTLRQINNENSDLTENSVTLGLSKRF
jgi:uncharacterized protein (PEP-CTERM system associated)